MIPLIILLNCNHFDQQEITMKTSIIFAQWPIHQAASSEIILLLRDKKGKK